MSDDESVERERRRLKWWRGPFAYEAQQVEVLRPLGYRHHGLRFSDGRIVHFSGELTTKRNASVRVGQWSDFESPRVGPIRFVRYWPFQRLPDVIVEARAEHLLGSGGYHFLIDNCEHYATWAMTGSYESRQFFPQRAARNIVKKAKNVAADAFWKVPGPLRDVAGRLAVGTPVESLRDVILQAFDVEAHLSSEVALDPRVLLILAQSFERVADAVERPMSALHRKHIEGGPDWPSHAARLSTVASRLARLVLVDTWYAAGFASRLLNMLEEIPAEAGSARSVAGLLSFLSAACGGGALHVGAWALFPHWKYHGPRRTSSGVRSTEYLEHWDLPMPSRDEEEWRRIMSDAGVRAALAELARWLILI